ncbi:MAG: hypothetical protein ACPGWR_03925 [Ardenticatenaceae bacterium]
MRSAIRSVKAHCNGRACNRKHYAARKRADAVALGGTMYQLSRKLLIKTEHSSKENLADMFGSQSRDVCGI